MYSVSMNIDRSFCRDVVPAEAVVGNGLANGHGDGGDVAEGFAADVVQVVEVIGVDFGEAVDVVAGHRVEEEGEVLFDLCSDAFLDFGVRGEQVDGPGNAGGCSVVACAKEGHYLVAHGVEGEGGFAGGFQAHVVFDDQGNDIFIFSVGLLVLLTHYVRCFAHNDLSALKNIAVHFRGEVFCQGDESCKAVQHARAYVKGEDEAVGFADRGLGVLEGVEIGTEACFADDVESGAVEPFEDFDGHAAGLCYEHVALPELREE